MSEEIWRPIPGYHYYEASTEGRIRSLDADVVLYDKYKKPYSKHYFGRVLRQTEDKRYGYTYVTLATGLAASKRVGVHTLVALAFVPNPYNYRYIQHIDGDKANNRPTNLVWVLSGKSHHNFS